MKVRIDKNLNISNNIDKISIDIIEILSRSVVDTTINNVIFKQKNNVENIPTEWINLIDIIKNNNDLERLLKSDVKYKSKYGKSYVGYDFWKGTPIIWIADEDVTTNKAIRINGMQTFAIQVTRTYAKVNGASILTNKIVYTNQTKSVLFQGGFGVAKRKTDNSNRKAYDKINPASFPIDFTSLETPKYIVDAFQNGDYEHNLGRLPANEFLNKDIRDNLEENEMILSDWYPAQDMIDLINSFIQYFAWELQLDHTRVIGLFSNQDIKGITNETEKSRLAALLQRARTQESENYGLSGEDETIRKRLILKTLGSAETNLVVMNSKLEGMKHTDTISALMTTFWKLCGYSWGSDTNQVYENVSQTQNSNKGVYETTKEKIELFTRQWNGLLMDIAFSYFKLKGVPKTMDQIINEFDKYVDFKLISNVLQDENNDWKKTIEIYGKDLISKERALRLLYPDMTQEELDTEIKLLEENEMIKKQEESLFANENPFGSENDDKNNNDLTKKGNEDE